METQAFELWEPARMFEGDVRRADIVCWESLLGSRTASGSGARFENSTTVEMVSDDWTWCADPNGHLSNRHTYRH
jgi:hypothetical protein